MKILVFFVVLEISDIGWIIIIFKIDVLNGELVNVLFLLNLCEVYRKMLYLYSYIWI